jgi:hypothetical protein
MTRRAILTVDQLDITLEQHKTLLDLIDAWTANPDHVCDRCSRNFVSGETSVRIQIQNRTKTELESTLTALDEAVVDLPGEWGTPSEDARFKNE